MTEEAEASGLLAELYQQVREVFGSVPNNAKMLGVSPQVLASQIQMVGYHMQHPHISAQLNTLIRYLVSVDNDNTYCIRFNEALLRQAGLDEETLAAIRKGKRAGVIAERQWKLLQFVREAMAAPTSLRGEHIAALKDEQWSEQDIFDAVELGARMVYVGKIFKAFQIDQES